MSDEPRTKAELLPRIETARAALDDLIASLSDDQLVSPAPDGGWSVKDHLAHLTAWEAGIAALLQHKPRYAAMQMDAATYRNTDKNGLNAIIHQRTSRHSLQEVREAFRQGQQALADAVSDLSAADLLETYSHYQPDEPGDDSGAPIVGWITGNTCDHYDEHRAWIEALAR